MLFTGSRSEGLQVRVIDLCPDAENINVWKRIQLNGLDKCVNGKGYCCLSIGETAEWWQKAFTQIVLSWVNSGLLIDSGVHVNQVFDFRHSGKGWTTHIINACEDRRFWTYTRTWSLKNPHVTSCFNAQMTKLDPPSVKTRMAWRCCSKTASPTRCFMRAIRSKMVLKARFRSVPVCSAVGENTCEHAATANLRVWVSDTLDPPVTSNFFSSPLRSTGWPSKKSRMLTTSEISDEKKSSS